MNEVKDFHINYWGTNELSYLPQEKGRSLKKKLSVVSIFVFLLGLLPLAIFAYNNFSLKQTPEVSSVNIPSVIPSPAPTQAPTQIKSPTSDTVKNGDSYWRISKRNCGSGKFYLSIQSQNEGKPLHAGDSVATNCSL